MRSAGRFQGLLLSHAGLLYSEQIVYNHFLVFSCTRSSCLPLGHDHDMDRSILQICKGHIQGRIDFDLPLVRFFKDNMRHGLLLGSSKSNLHTSSGSLDAKQDQG